MIRKHQRGEAGVGEGVAPRVGEHRPEDECTPVGDGLNLSSNPGMPKGMYDTPERHSWLPVSNRVRYRNEANSDQSLLATSIGRGLSGPFQEQPLFDALDLVLHVTHGVDVRRDRGDSFVDEELDHLWLRGGLPADTRVDVELAAGLDDLAHEFENGRVEFVEAVGDVPVVAVDGERVLCEVVRPEGDEVDAGFADPSMDSALAGVSTMTPQSRFSGSMPTSCISAFARRMSSASVTSGSISSTLSCPGRTGARTRGVRA